MLKISAKTKGVDTVIRSFQELPKEVQAKISKELAAFGMETVSEAKRATPVDEGLLRNSISFDLTGNTVILHANAPYAAYIEFGTRKFAAQYVSTLPSTYQELAAKFKGSTGGTFADMVRNITAWAKRKGIDESAAYPIVLKILREGIRPRPYLVPAIQRNLLKLNTRLKKL